MSKQKKQPAPQQSSKRKTHDPSRTAANKARRIAKEQQRQITAAQKRPVVEQIRKQTREITREQRRVALIFLRAAYIRRQFEEQRAREMADSLRFTPQVLAAEVCHLIRKPQQNAN